VSVKHDVVNKLCAIYMAAICQLSEMLCSLCRDDESHVEETSTADVVSFNISLFICSRYRHLCFSPYMFFIHVV